VGGVPAKEIKKRFDDAVIGKLLKIQWWNWSPENVRDNLSKIMSGQL
jgi:virginiamycin A acetyltransferase